MQSFDGTEAAFRLICFLFNLIADFKCEVTHNEAPQLMALRICLLVIGAIRGADGHKQILRLGLRGRWRQCFQALLARIAALAVSTVAQFTAEQKKPRLDGGNPAATQFGHLYFRLSNGVFGINRSALYARTYKGR